MSSDDGDGNGVGGEEHVPYWKLLQRQEARRQDGRGGFDVGAARDAVKDNSMAVPSSF